MTIEPAYSFVLWAIPRFHRANAAQSEIPPVTAQQDGTAAKVAHDPLLKRKQPLLKKAAPKLFLCWAGSNVADNAQDPA